MRFGVFDGSREIKLIRLQNESLFRNCQPSKPAGATHVENDFFVHQHLVMKAKIVAVGIQLFLPERIDADVGSQLRLDFAAAQNHGNAAESFG